MLGRIGGILGRVGGFFDSNPWAGRLLGAGLNAYGNYTSARNMQDAAAAAAQPRPYHSTNTREPWGPAAAHLAGIPDIAQQIFNQARSHRPPPRGHFPGASSQMRDIVNAMRDRALNSTFVPQAQDLAMNMASNANPLMSQVFDRAMNYQSGPLSTLIDRGMGGGLNPMAARMPGFLDRLLANREMINTQLP